MIRLVAAAVVALALGFAAVAPASAGPAQIQRPTAGVTTSWLANAWAVLQGYLTGAPTRPVSTATSGTLSTSTGSSSTLVPMTGSCIDPMGNRVTCNQ
jgi:hypothetical protein